MSEEWRSAKGFEGFYEVSSHGGVRSLDRLTTWGSQSFVVPGQVLAPYPNSRSGHLVVDLRAEGKRTSTFVHRLVLLTFVGEPPFEGAQGLHWDDDPSNNHVENLRWGTFSDNAYDKVRNGRHHNANKTHCVHGHEYTGENTFLHKDGRRECRTCRRISRRESMRRRRRRAPAVA